MRTSYKTGKKKKRKKEKKRPMVQDGASKRAGASTEQNRARPITAHTFEKVLVVLLARPDGQPVPVRTARARLAAALNA